jgi:hypothetical protein
MSDRCDLSDLPVDQCACRKHNPPAWQTKDRGVLARFPARFDSKCADCGLATCEGDTIARTDEGDYICEACAS